MHESHDHLEHNGRMGLGPLRLGLGDSRFYFIHNKKPYYVVLLRALEIPTALFSDFLYSRVYLSERYCVRSGSRLRFPACHPLFRVVLASLTLTLTTGIETNNVKRNIYRTKSLTKSNTVYRRIDYRTVYGYLRGVPSGAEGCA